MACAFQRVVGKVGSNFVVKNMNQMTMPLLLCVQWLRFVPWMACIRMWLAPRNGNSVEDPIVVASVEERSRSL